MSLGLFDYSWTSCKFADDCRAQQDRAGDLVPLTRWALLFLNGFCTPSASAGLAATIWAVIVPALMAR